MNLGILYEKHAWMTARNYMFLLEKKSNLLCNYSSSMIFFTQFCQLYFHKKDKDIAFSLLLLHTLKNVSCERIIRMKIFTLVFEKILFSPNSSGLCFVFFFFFVKTCDTVTPHNIFLTCSS